MSIMSSKELNKIIDRVKEDNEARLRKELDSIATTVMEMKDISKKKKKEILELIQKKKEKKKIEKEELIVELVIVDGEELFKDACGFLWKNDVGMVGFVDKNVEGKDIFTFIDNDKEILDKFENLVIGLGVNVAGYTTKMKKDKLN